MEYSLGVRLKNAGSNLTQVVSLLAALAIATATGGPPTSRWSLIGFLAIVAAAAVYLVLALRELFRADPQDKVVFKFPNTKRAVSKPRLERCLGLIGHNREQRTDHTYDKISDYMATLLGESSKAWILTRDLSWEGSAHPQLNKLASSGSLWIFHCDADKKAKVPDNIAKYQAAGATVKSTRIKSKVRMTMVESSGSETVAIGYRDDDRHVILRIRDHNDPAFQLAVTLFSALKGSI